MFLTQFQLKTSEVDWNAKECGYCVNQNNRIQNKIIVEN